MPSAEEKLKNMVSAARKHAKVFKAKFDERVQKAAARTPEEKDMAHERRKAKVAQAKMELHQAKARHAAKNLAGKRTHGHGHIHKPPAPAAAYYGTAQPVVSNQVHQPVVGSQGQQPVGTAGPMTGTAVPSYPLGGYHAGYK